MAYEAITYTVTDSVATITMNRPKTYNAMTIGMINELNHAFKSVGHDSAVRAVIFTGNGRGFSSGADLPEIQKQLAKIDITEILRRGLNETVTIMRTLEKPIVCAINGVAAGAGGSLCLASDFRIASENASFVFAAFVNIGLVPDAGGTYLLQKLVGPAKALELMMLADSKNRVDAQTALELGIVNRVVEHDHLLEKATDLATKLAQMPTKAIGLTKRAIDRATTASTLPEALDFEAQLQGIAFKTHDFQEGVMAFIEKREPKFKGE